MGLFIAAIAPIHRRACRQKPREHRSPRPKPSSKITALLVENLGPTSPEADVDVTTAAATPKRRR